MNSKFLIPLALALVFLAPTATGASAQSTNDEVSDLVDSGYEHLASGDPQKAAKKFHRARKLTDSQDAVPLVALAETAIFLGDFEKASDWTSQASGLVDDAAGRAVVDWVVAQTHLHHARDHRLFQEKRRQDELLETAEGLLRQAIPHLGERAPRAWFDLARVRTHQSRFPEALEALDTYFESEPGANTNLEAIHLRCWLKTESSHLSTPPSADSVVTKPKKIFAPQVSLTPAAFEFGVQGFVTLSGFISPEGIGCYRVLTGSPFDLNRATLQAATAWRFEPATIDGEPAIVPYNVTFNMRTQ